MTDQPSFNPGVLVQVKSGGPLMTVVETNDAGVVCTWMERKGKTGYDRKTSTFPPAVLAKYQPTGPITVGSF